MRYADFTMSTSKSVQKSTKKQLQPRTVLRSGELEFRLTSVLTKSKGNRSFAERLVAINEATQFDPAESELSEREKMIAGAFGFKGFETPDWQLFLKSIDKKPKLNIDLARLIFEQAISSGNDRHLLFFCCLAPKGMQQIVPELVKGRNNWRPVDLILDAFSDSSITKADLSKIHKSIGFLASIVEQQNKSQFICKLVLTASNIEHSVFAWLTISKKKALLRDITKILLNEDFSGPFTDAFSVRKSSDEVVDRLIKNMIQLLVGEKYLADFLLKLLTVGRSKVVLKKAVFAKMDIGTIASLAASQEVREFLLTEKDCYKTQLQTMLRQGGIGALMQVIDQKKHFDLIVDPDWVISHFSSKNAPSTKVIELLSAEIIRKSERAVMEVVEKRTADVVKSREEALEVVKDLEKKCAELNLKTEALENQLRVGKKEQIVGKDRMTQQAQLQVLIEFSRFVEDLRVLSSGSFVGSESVVSVFKNAERQLKSFNVVVVGAVGKPAPIGEDCFKFSGGSRDGLKMVGSPAYVFRTVDQQVVLVWGELRSN